MTTGPNPPGDSLRDRAWLDTLDALERDDDREYDDWLFATADDPPASDEERDFHEAQYEAEYVRRVEAEAMALEAGGTPRSDNYETGDQDHELPRVRE